MHAHTSSEETVSMVLCFVCEAFFCWHVCVKTLGTEGCKGPALGIVFAEGGVGVLPLL
jgi:hypothetical protein